MFVNVNYTSILRTVSVQEMSGNITFIVKLVLKGYTTFIWDY